MVCAQRAVVPHESLIMALHLQNRALAHKSGDEFTHFKPDFVCVSAHTVVVFSQVDSAAADVHPVGKRVISGYLIFHPVQVIQKLVVVLSSHYEAFCDRVGMNDAVMELFVCQRAQLRNEPIEDRKWVVGQGKSNPKRQARAGLLQKGSDFSIDVVQSGLHFGAKTPESTLYISAFFGVVSKLLLERLVSTYPDRNQDGCDRTYCLNPCWPIKVLRKENIASSHQHSYSSDKQGVKVPVAMQVRSNDFHWEILA